MTSLHTKFHELEADVADHVHERSQEIHTSTLAILSELSHFQLGPPGTAKSLLVEQSIKRIDGLTDEDYFRWLLSRFTTPEEIFGAPDLLMLKQGKYKRVTERKLPRARFVFMDETFKASSSISNLCLTAMNEREFYNLDDDPHIPMIVLYGASNELAEGEELNAFWDRFLFRHVVRELQETSNWMTMMTGDMPKNPEKILHIDDIVAGQEAVRGIHIPTDIHTALNGLRHDLQADGVSVSDRRWTQCRPIIRAEAFMNGRDTVEIEDLRPLMHVLWDDLMHRKTVTSHILNLANPIDKVAMELLEALAEQDTLLTRAIRDHKDNKKAKAKVCIEVHKKFKRIKKEMNGLMQEAEVAETESVKLDELKKRFKVAVRKLMIEGFEQDPENFPED